MSRRRRRAVSTALVTIVAAGVGGSPARAAISPNLSELGRALSLSYASTGTLVPTQRTASYRLPASGAQPRVLVVGTGVAKNVFPEPLRTADRLVGSGIEVADPVGYGTIAASVIWQLLPGAQITSRVPGTGYEGLLHLEDTLRWAADHAGEFDALLLAVHPAWMREPVPHMIDTSIGGRSVWDLAVDAVLRYPGTLSTEGSFLGIPRDRALRAQVFSRAKGKERTAVELAVARAESWGRIVSAVREIRDAGLVIVAPAGDFTRKAGTALVPVETQTVSGIAALPEVVTVGAAYEDSGGQLRVSPVSARGPTSGLDLKPDLLAPTNVTALVPKASAIGQTADIAATAAAVSWADGAIPPGALGADAKKILQGSSMVAASVVAATVANLSARGFPAPRAARTGLDARCVRGLLWERASQRQVTGAYPWEQGAGVLPPVAAAPVPLPPIPLEPLRLEAGDGDPAQATVPLCGGISTGTSSAVVTGFIGPDAVGAATSRRWDDAGMLRSTVAGNAVSIATEPRLHGAGAAQGGVYAGTLTLGGAGGDARFPVTVVRDSSVDLTAAYARAAGERANAETFLLTPGLPASVGSTGGAFKNLMKSGLDPFQLPVQARVTDALGKARLTKVPPGFWRVHLLSDFRVQSEQPRPGGWMREEPLGVRPAGGVLEGFVVAAQPACDTAPTPVGPLSPACITPEWMSQTYTSVNASTYPVCRVVEASITVQTMCRSVVMEVPAGVVTRQVDLVRYADLAFCGVSLPGDGSPLTTAGILATAQENACAAQSGSGWAWTEGAPRCGAGALLESGLTGRFNLSGSLKALPISTFSYRFVLPSPNRDAQIGLSFAYRAENALVFAAISIGSDATQGEAPYGHLVVAGDPKLELSPELGASGRNGTAYIEGGFISGGAQTGTITFVVIPTTWVNVEDIVTAAQVQICNVGLEVLTFARKSWSEDRGPAMPGTRQIAVSGNYGPGQPNALDRTAPGYCRDRLAYDAGDRRWLTLGPECEEISFAVQIPKNDAPVGAPDPYAVKFAGEPARFADVKTPGGASLCSPAPDPANPARMACTDPAIDALYDPDGDVWSAWCNPADPVYGPACETGGAAGRYLDFDGISTNGRFSLNLPISDAAIRRGAGGVWVYLGEGPGPHAAAVRGGPLDGRRFPTGAFYDHIDGLNASHSEVATGVLTIGAGNTLVASISAPDGSTHTLETDLDCVTVDGRVVCAR